MLRLTLAAGHYDRPEALRDRRAASVDDYGVSAADVEWVQGGLEEPGRIPFEPAEPPGVRWASRPRSARWRPL